MNCMENDESTEYIDAVEYFTTLYNITNGLIKTNETELRYRGSSLNNYVTFNGEEAGYRIVNQK